MLLDVYTLKTGKGMKEECIRTQVDPNKKKGVRGAFTLSILKYSRLRFLNEHLISCKLVNLNSGEGHFTLPTLSLIIGTAPRPYHKTLSRTKYVKHMSQPEGKPVKNILDPNPTMLLFIESPIKTIGSSELKSALALAACFMLQRNKPGPKGIPENAARV